MFEKGETPLEYVEFVTKGLRTYMPRLPEVSG